MAGYRSMVSPARKIYHFMVAVPMLGITFANNWDENHWHCAYDQSSKRHTNKIIMVRHFKIMVPTVRKISLYCELVPGRISSIYWNQYKSSIGDTCYSVSECMFLASHQCMREREIIMYGFKVMLVFFFLAILSL